MKKITKATIILSSISVVVAVFFCSNLFPDIYGWMGFAVSKLTPIVSKENENIVVASYNTRIYTTTDRWQKCYTFRATLIKEGIQEMNPDIIGFQEAQDIHRGYYNSILKDYDVTYKNRENKKGSEACPIYFRKDKFNCLKTGHFWLSETPDVESISWGAACVRVCSYAVLEEKKSNKELVVFNTHLDHVSAEARINEIKVVTDKRKELGFEDKASLIMGDMNDYLGSPTINHLFDNFNDSWAEAKDKNGIPSHHATYQSYGGKLDNTRIDFIGVSKSKVEVEKYNCLSKTYNKWWYKNVYASDHFPVYVDIKLT